MHGCTSGDTLLRSWAWHRDLNPHPHSKALLLPSLCKQTRSSPITNCRITRSFTDLGIGLPPLLALLSVGSCYGAVALSSCAATGDVAPAYLPLLRLGGTAFSMGLQVWSGQTGSKMPLGKGRGPAVLPTGCCFFFFFSLSAGVHKENLSVVAGKKK